MKDRAGPNRPVVHAGALTKDPACPLPEESWAVVPAPSSSFHQPTGPVEVATGALTVRLKPVVLEMPPPVAVTVREAAPSMAEADAEKVIVVEQLGAGVQEVGEKEAVTPKGRPETEKPETA